MRRSTILAAVAGAFASFPLAAEPRAEAPGEIRIIEENDLFNWFTQQTDRYYTQGLRGEWLSSSRKSDAHFLPGITHEDWCSLVCGRGARQGSVNTGYAIGQSMYTPADVTIAAPQPNDRPWAGLLYGSRIARISYEDPSFDAQRQDRIEVSLGIVGPASLAKDIQIGWHDLWGFGPLNGWDNQLRNEPVLQLRYETALRWPRTGGRNADAVARVRANLGNALTSLEADATVRIGWNLTGFGVSQNPLAPPPAAFATTGQANALRGAGWRASFNLFLRAGIKAVAHNILLDGNSFARNDIRIERTPFVPELAAGVEVGLAGFRVSFQFIHRGSEFETRRGGDAPAQQFGSITVALPLDG